MAAISQISSFLEQKVEDIDTHVGYAVFKATTVGKQRMTDVIEFSTTPTGEARAARGGHPGRVETGQMLDDVRHDVHVRGNLENRHHIGEWGWLDGHEKYYEIQEDGWGKIQAMNALNLSYIAAREKLLEELGK